MKKVFGSLWSEFWLFWWWNRLWLVVFVKEIQYTLNPIPTTYDFEVFLSSHYSIRRAATTFDQLLPLVQRTHSLIESLALKNPLEITTFETHVTRGLQAFLLHHRGFRRVATTSDNLLPPCPTKPTARLEPRHWEIHTRNPCKILAKHMCTITASSLAWFERLVAHFFSRMSPNGF